MSKQSNAKAEQGYVPRYVNTCGNCAHYRSDKKNNGYGYTVETNMRCSIGGFKVMKLGTCQEFSKKS